MLIVDPLESLETPEPLEITEIPETPEALETTFFDNPAISPKCISQQKLNKSSSNAINKLLVYKKILTHKKEYCIY